ncbi:hypothetical protein ACQEV2_19385 [Streptomyces sp. CA-251387]|uniref:hypothetical protein n=1 Tax=Streptomyces sp. CA-251387 TaxID=3240064 RepID=UPI003D8D151A
MFNGKKIAAISGLLGGLAMTCIGIGITQAHAAADPPACTTDSQGNTNCTQRIVGQTPEGDNFIVRRSVNCQPTKPVSVPAPGLFSNGQTRIGPHITCSDLGPEVAPATDSNEISPGAVGSALQHLFGGGA